MLTKTATKILKKSSRIICQTAENGYIYIANGYFILRITPIEYAEFVQPATMREPGDFDLTATSCKPRELDIVNILDKYSAAAEKGGNMKLANISFSTGKSELLPACCKEKNFVAFFNRDFLSAWVGDFTFMSDGYFCPMVAYIDSEPVAAFMPVKPMESFAAAARGYFGMDATQPASKEDAETVANLRARLADKDAAITQMGQQNALLRSQLDSLKSSKDRPSTDDAKTISDLRAQLSAAAKELEALKSIISQKESIEAPATREEPAKEPATGQEVTAVQAIAAKFSEIPGATVTVKGARTSSPVIWIAAATKEAEKAVKAAGARWAAKRGAYYYSVA